MKSKTHFSLGSLNKHLKFQLRYEHKHISLPVSKSYSVLNNDFSLASIFRATLHEVETVKLII